MPPSPLWLPSKLVLPSAQPEAEDVCYECFVRDFCGAGFTLDGLPVEVSMRRNATWGKPEGFVHLITREDKSSGRRYLEPARAERLPWVRSVIENWERPEVKRFVHYEFGEFRTYTWLDNGAGFEFVVVLRELKGSFRIITAYPVDGTGSHNKLLRKYQERASE